MASLRLPLSFVWSTGECNQILHFPSHPHCVSGSNNLFGIIGAYFNGTQSVFFQRQLSTGDQNDQNISAGIQNIIWAFGRGDAMNPSQHDSDDCGTLPVNFLGSSGSTTPNQNTNFLQFPSDVYYTMQWSFASIAVNGLNVPVIQINLSLAKPIGQYWMSMGLGSSMSGSDMMMVSVASNGSAYAVDRTGVGEVVPVLDTSRSGINVCLLRSLIFFNY